MGLLKQLVIGVLIAGWPVLAVADNATVEGDAEDTATGGWVAKGDWQQRVLQRGPTTHSGPEQARVDQQRVVRWSPSRQGQLRTASHPASGTTTTTSRTAMPAAGAVRPVSGTATTADGTTTAPRTTTTAPRTTTTAPRTARTATTAPGTIQTVQEEIPPGDEQMTLTPMATDDAYESIEMGEPEMVTAGPGYGDCAGGGCAAGGVYSEGCGGPYGGYGPGFYGVRSEWWARDLSLAVGGHGFKGPFDQGRNGNFGLNEGVNFGAPLGGPWGWGYQVGFTAAHSNFAGDQATGVFRRGDRDQFFFTAGLFHRALSSAEQGSGPSEWAGGIQWGVAFDLLRDTYYANGDMTQLRHEIGYVFAGGQREIGYLGVYGLGDDELLIDHSNVSLEPTDMFAFYYRRHFEGGGEGRIWAGFTGFADGLVGADLIVPLGGSWALENRINYLIPEEGRGPDGQQQESWGLSIRLVWYLGQQAHCAQQSPYRPMLSVADNSSFMFDFVNR